MEQALNELMDRGLSVYIEQCQTSEINSNTYNFLASKIKLYIAFKLHNLEMVNKNIEECNQTMENMMEDIRINNIPILDTTYGSYIELTGDQAYLAISNKFKKLYDSDIMLKEICDTVGWWYGNQGSRIKLNCEPTYGLKHPTRRNDII